MPETWDELLKKAEIAAQTRDPNAPDPLDDPKIQELIKKSGVTVVKINIPKDNDTDS